MGGALSSTLLTLTCTNFNIRVFRKLPVSLSTSRRKGYGQKLGGDNTPSVPAAINTDHTSLVGTVLVKPNWQGQQCPVDMGHPERKDAPTSWLAQLSLRSSTGC